MNYRNRQIFRVMVIFAIGLVFSSASAEENIPPPRSYVKPIDFSALAKGFDALPKRDRELIRLYLKGAQGYVLTDADGAFPHGGTEHWRNIAERTHGAAVLVAVPSDWPEELKTRCRTQSVAWVGEFAAHFKEKPDFGNVWQGSWWVGEMGEAAWFLWDRLDPGLQNDVASMVIFHADRIAAKMPGAHVEKDTEAETVSWNSTILTLAANMMPTHPHNAKWQAAAKRYIYTIFGTASDAKDSTPGDDGIPVKDWVVGANIHDDFSLENHNRFHIDYVYASYRFMMQGAALYRVAGNTLPKAFNHHITEVHDQVIDQCLSGSKFVVYVSDNDWKRYHLWTESPAVHGFVALMTGSPLDAALEEESLKKASSYWKQFPPNFQYDNAYACGKAWTPRIADIVLLHLLSGPSPKPMPAVEVEKKLEGVHQKQDVNLLTQYSKAGSFRSFFWGPGPVVRQVEPKSDAWMLLPLSSNYRPAINGKQTSDSGAKTVSAKGADWFWVMRSYTNGEQEAFISLPDEIVVTMNVIPAKALQGARTVDSFVAVEKPHQTFKIYFEDGTAICSYGQTNWTRSDQETGHDLNAEWINLADSIGYITESFSSGSGQMVLPPAGARGSLSLFHVAKPTQDVRLLTAIFPNQSHAKTKKLAEQRIGFYKDGLMICKVADYFVWANFSNQEATLQLPATMQAEGLVKAPPNTVVLWQKKNGKWEVLK